MSEVRAAFRRRAWAIRPHRDGGASREWTPEPCAARAVPRTASAVAYRQSV